MTKEDKLYAVGSFFCIVAIGAMVFHLIRVNSKENNQEASAAQATLAQTASTQSTTDAKPVDMSGNVSEKRAIDNAETMPSINPASDISRKTNTDTIQNGSGGFRGNMPNIPEGSKPFFGEVSSVGGSQIVVTTMGGRGPAAPGSGVSDSATTPTKTTINVTLTNNTTFSGGTKDAIVTGARIFGYGTANSDGSINAANIQINPTMPAGGGSNRGGINQ